MDDAAFLKPPSAGMWLLALLCAALLGERYIGGLFNSAIYPLVLICTAAAAYTVSRWLGRAIGFTLGYAREQQRWDAVEREDRR